MFRVTALLLLCIFATFEVQGDCPDKAFICPTGESFTIGTCWSWRHFNCQTCRDIISEMKRKCRTFSCRGSVNNWYGRNDGCSAGVVAGAMTEVFRAACAIHDICYATPGRSKSQCDNEFKSNMLRTCGMPGIGSVAYPVCAATAGIAYLAVRDHGNNFPNFAASCREV